MKVNIPDSFTIKVPKFNIPTIDKKRALLAVGAVFACVLFPLPVLSCAAVYFVYKSSK